MNKRTALNALAREAILYALPIYEMARMRASSSPRKNAQGELSDPTAGPGSLKRWITLFSHALHQRLARFE